MKGIASTMLSCAVAVAGGAGIAGGASRARAAYVEVYGGPTYSPAEGGYTKPWVPRAPAGPVVNSAGAAIAYAEKRDSIGGRGLRAVRWDGSGAPAMELQDLGLHPLVAGTESRPAAINSAGSVAGFAQKWDAGGAYRGYWAVRWDSAGAATELENLGGTDSRGISDNRATGITAAGIVYGAAHKYDAAGNDLGARRSMGHLGEGDGAGQPGDGPERLHDMRGGCREPRRDRRRGRDQIRWGGQPVGQLPGPMGRVRHGADAAREPSRQCQQ